MNISYNIFKNYYILVAKYIFVIFKKKVKIFAKKVFLISSGENVIWPLLATMKRYCWPTPQKIHYCPLLGKNPYGAH